MSTDFKLADDEELQGDRLPPPASAWHHAVLIDADDSRVGKKGGALDGIRFAFESRASTAPNQQGREFEIVLYDGKSSDKDGGKFRTGLQRRLITRLLLATGYADESKKGQDVQLDYSQLPGRQCIVLIQVDSSGQFPRIDFDWNLTDENPKNGIYAIDDPIVAHVPLDHEALAMAEMVTPGIQARALALRSKGSKPAAAKDKAPAAKPAAATKSTPAPAPAASNAPADDPFAASGL